MYITKLKLTNFRNLRSYEIEPGKITLLLGKNGVGKTNLIESIRILSVCKSWRTKKDTEIIGWDMDVISPLAGETKRDGSSDHHPKPLLGQEGQNTARIEAEIISDSGDVVNPAIAQTGEKKHAFLGDKQVPVSLLIGTLPTVIFVPENMDLPEASPGKRRRHLDMLIAQTDTKYTQNLLKYNQVLKARNKLLDGIAKRKNKINELDFWDKSLIFLGTEILKTRNIIVAQLNESIKNAYEKLSYGSKNGRELTLIYLSSVNNVDRFDEELVASRDQELRYGNTIIGPHRDDWQMCFNKIDIRMSASRGETRAALLALKMAEIEVLRTNRKEVPVLLLDDVFAELDKNHSEAILKFFDKGQIFITATDAEYIPESVKQKAKTIKLY